MRRTLAVVDRSAAGRVSNLQAAKNLQQAIGEDAGNVCARARKRCASTSTGDAQRSIKLLRRGPLLLCERLQLHWVRDEHLAIGMHQEAAALQRVCWHMQRRWW